MKHEIFCPDKSGNCPAMHESSMNLEQGRVLADLCVVLVAGNNQLFWPQSETYSSLFLSVFIIPYRILLWNCGQQNQFSKPVKRQDFARET